MANVEVSFDRIDVDDDGDPGLTDGGGDFYWSLNVNGARIGHRSVSNTLTVGNCGVIDLGASTSVELQSNQDLIVSGFVADKDQGTSGADERDDFAHAFDRSQNWGDDPHQVALNDSRMACTLHYTISVE